MEMESAVDVYPLAGQVSSALQGAVYPLSPRELGWVAVQNDAPKTVISLIAGLPLRRYESLDAVQVAVNGPAR